MGHRSAALLYRSALSHIKSREVGRFPGRTDFISVRFNFQIDPDRFYLIIRPTPIGQRPVSWHSKTDLDRRPIFPVRFPVNSQFCPDRMPSLSML